MEQNIETMHIVVDEVALKFLMNLKHIIKANGMTMTSVSKRLGRGKAWLNEILTQRRATPLLGAFVSLANLLNYDISESINTRFYRNPEKFVNNLRSSIKRSGKNEEFFVNFAFNQRKARDFIRGYKTPITLEVMHELEQVVKMLEASRKS